jgi:hypothetical protein
MLKEMTKLGVNLTSSFLLCEHLILVLLCHGIPVRENRNTAVQAIHHQAPTLIGCLIVKEQFCVKQRNEIMKNFLNRVKRAFLAGNPDSPSKPPKTARPRGLQTPSSSPKLKHISISMSSQTTTGRNRRLHSAGRASNRVRDLQIRSFKPWTLTSTTLDLRVNP